MKKVLSVTLVMAIIVGAFCSIGVAATDAVTSYLDYLAEIHEWDDQSFYPTYNDILVFIAVENPFTDISGLKYGYLYKKDLNTGEVNLLVAANVSAYDLVNERIYYSSGSQIVSIDINGNDRIVVLDETDTITDFQANDKLVYYVMLDNLYRYYVDSATTDFVADVENIVYFEPISNNEIAWWSQDMLTDDNESSKCNYVNMLTNEAFLIESYSWMTDDTPIMSISPMALQSSYKVNGKTIPHSLYDNGTYFTKDGTACLCHKCKSSCTTCPVNDKEKPAPTCECKHSHTSACYGSCNCKTINGAIQCAGFSNFIYNYLFGDYGTRENISTNVTTAAEAKSLVSSICDGTILEVRSKGHYLVVISADANGAVIYEANTDNKCGVKLSEKTYADLVATFKNVTAKWARTHNAIAISTTQHRVCRETGCLSYNILQNHVLTGTVGSRYCRFCNYDERIAPNSIGDPVDITIHQIDE